MNESNIRTLSSLAVEICQIKESSSQELNLYFVEELTTNLLTQISSCYQHVLLITDKYINFKITKEMLKLPKSRAHVLHVSLEGGESVKTPETALDVIEFLISNDCGKNTLLIALGGGSISDLAGYVASIYLRGIDLAFIPTTLLSQVDACLGGKNGINVSGFKNMIGTIYHPKYVVSSFHFLRSLQHEELLSGFAEMIKYGLICDRKYFDDIVSSTNLLSLGDEKALLNFIKRSQEIKLEIVKADAKEKNLRQILNFGHTFGHAFEALAKGSIPHGICVAIGIFFESFLSYKLSVLPQEDFEKVLNALETFHYFTTFQLAFSKDTFVKALVRDKKNRNRQIAITLLESIGNVKQNGDSVVHYFELSDLEFCFESMEKFFKSGYDPRSIS